jgi:nucleotide-binding universal stress UspA family protein
VSTSTSTPTVPAEGKDPESAPGDARATGEPPVRDVVVGVDGGECALSAVRWAAREAGARGAPLRIVHAAPYLGEPRSPGAPPPELARARQITAAAYTVARHTAADVRASTEVVPSDPTTVLLRAGAAAQLLVLGISTTGAADELVLASVAQRVVGRSTQPVAVVPRARPENGTGRAVVALLGLGDPAEDEPVLAFAAKAAQRAGRPLSLLDTGARATADDNWASPLSDVEVHRTALPGAPAVQLLAAACPTPLLVLAAGHGRFGRDLDGLRRWLLRHCTSPMALVPSRSAAPAPPTDR